MSNKHHGQGTPRPSVTRSASIRAYASSERRTVDLASRTYSCTWCEREFTPTAFQQRLCSKVCRWTEQKWKRFNAKYGMSRETFKQLWAETANGCPICSLPYDNPPCEDHDHVTGVFRGFICNRCNLALGYARDSVDVLKALAEYLETHTDTKGTLATCL